MFYPLEICSIFIKPKNKTKIADIANLPEKPWAPPLREKRN